MGRRPPQHRLRLPHRRGPRGLAARALATVRANCARGSSPRSPEARLRMTAAPRSATKKPARPFQRHGPRCPKAKRPHQGLAPSRKRKSRRGWRASTSPSSRRARGLARHTSGG
jgi:hypothetical protein